MPRAANTSAASASVSSEALKPAYRPACTRTSRIVSVGSSMSSAAPISRRSARKRGNTASAARVQIMRSGNASPGRAQIAPKDASVSKVPNPGGRAGPSPRSLWLHGFALTA